MPYESPPQQLRDLNNKEVVAAFVPCTTRFIEKEVTAGRLRKTTLSRKLVRFRCQDVEAWNFVQCGLAWLAQLERKNS